MGKILSPSKPKAPSVVYYTPAPSTTVTNPAPSGTTAPEPEKTTEEAAAEKAENLLRRNRSRLGTVLTSFRGILSQNDLSATRKTLLGE